MTDGPFFSHLLFSFIPGNVQVKLDHDDDDGDSEFEISDEEDEEEEVKKTLFLSGVVDPRSGAFSGP
jgi:hypothetical protein